MNIVRATPVSAGKARWSDVVVGPGVRILVLAAVAGCGGGGSAPTPVVASVEVTPSAATRQVGETVQLSVAVKDANGDILSGQSVSWSSSNATVASVSASGLVTANVIGVASISAAAGGHSGSAVITVAGTPVASVTVTPAVDTILVGETVTLSAVLKDASNQVLTDRTVAWTSSDPTVASVGLSSGMVTGVADGDATISATAENKSASSVITVFGPCSLFLTLVIDVGDMVQGNLANTDCRLDDDSYADGYYINVDVDTDVQIDMTSTVFNTYLWLLEWLQNGDLVIVNQNNEAGANPNDSRLTFTLLAGHDYFILANSFEAGQFGPYGLSVMEAAPLVAGRVMAHGGRSKRASPDRVFRVVRRR